MQTKQFIQGIPEGCELIAKDVFTHYKASVMQTIADIDVNIDWKHSKAEVLKKMCGGVMVSHHANLLLGTIGKFFAVRNEATGHETILANIDLDWMVKHGYADAEHIRTTMASPMRGTGWRKHYKEAIQNVDWRNIKADTYAIAMDYGLSQVNNMDDLANQFDYWKQPDSDAYRLVYVEGVTQITDEELEQYDYFNQKPEGHKGGGMTFEDEDPEADYDYESTQELSYIENAQSVWLLRGETKALFVNCEGHHYSKYILLPVGMKEKFEKKAA